VLVQGLSGLFNTDDVLFDGPLHKLATERGVKLAGVIHHYTYELIVLLASIHVAANLFYAIVIKEPLIPAMISGEKPAEDFVDAEEASWGSLAHAGICLVAAAAMVLGGIRLLGGEL